MKSGLWRWFVPAFLGSCLAGGCAKTLGPVPFLRLQLGGAPAGQEGGSWYAHYTGRDAKWQYLTVEWSNENNPMMLALNGAFTDKKYRCLVGDLPGGYPEDLDAYLLKSPYGGWPACREHSDQIIADYLRQGGKLTPAARRELRLSPK